MSRSPSARRHSLRLTALRLAFVIATAMLAGCGGGPGEPLPSPLLVSSVGSLQGQRLAVGDAQRFSGSQPLVALTLPPQPTVSPCVDTTLISTSDGIRWRSVPLTHASLPQPCVNQLQDAGDFLVIKSDALLNAAGQSCDLITLRKRDGQTACLIVPLAERARSGPPVFGLGLDPRQPARQAQLSRNGRYFIVPFTTQGNGSAAYSGFVRIDLAGDRPVVDIAYLAFGEQRWVDGSIDGRYLTWGAFWALDNGDLLFTEFTPTGADLSVGTVRHVYAVNTPGLADPLKVEKYLINVSDAAQRVDVQRSPLGQWFKGLHPEVTSLVLDGDVIPGPLTASQRVIYLIVDGAGLAADQCGAGTRRLVRVRIERDVGTVSFDTLGGTNLSTGSDGRPDGRRVMLSADAAALSGLRWDLATSTGKADIRLLRRDLASGACDAGETTLLTVAVDASVQAQQTTINRYINETPGYLFLRTMSDIDTDMQAASACVAGQGCAITAASMVLVYDKASGRVSNVPLGTLASGRYFLNAATSAVTSDRVYLSLKTAGAERHALAVLTPRGVSSIIELPQGVQPGSPLVLGD